MTPYPYRDVVARIRAERWSQRQDSTTDQLADLVAVANALGCQDAADHLRRFVLQRTNPDALPPHERIKP